MGRFELEKVSRDRRLKAISEFGLCESFEQTGLSSHCAAKDNEFHRRVAGVLHDRKNGIEEFANAGSWWHFAGSLNRPRGRNFDKGLLTLLKALWF
jgi:hypothetical protein